MSVIMLAGCGGPSKVGKEMRKQAYSRMDAVNARMVHEQAKSAFETGQLEQARVLLAEAIEKYPDQPAWHTLMGRILLEQHRLDEAKRDFEYAIELDPESSESAYYLGVLHERWSDDDDAVTYFTMACDLDPTRPQYALACAEALVACGRLEEARSRVLDRMDHFEHHAGLQHLLSQIAMLDNDPKAAVQHCESARLLEPQDVGMAHDLARMSFAAGDWTACLDAIDDIRRAQSEPSHADQWMEVRALMALGRSTQARTKLRELCHAEPGDGTRWRDLGLLGWDIGDWSSVSLAAAGLKGTDAFEYEAKLFEGLADKGRGDLEEASEKLESLAAAYPDRPEAWAVLAGIRMRRGDFQGSEQARALAVKWSPDHADARAVSGVYGTHGP
ncbi:MAG: tetratricopeptide repeat protein [Phycisphaerales bacterium]|nr:tetratricopeptide repeat protein [Phycisphaerales bacterium]